MSYLKPYESYATRLPVLKAGHLLKIGETFYMVTEVRRNRKKVALAAAQTDYRFYTTTSAEYTPMVGNLTMNRVVHLQYVAIDQTQDTKFWWLDKPLQSKEREEAIQPWGANLSAPLEVDKWSFDEAMHLRVTTGGAQNFYFEMIEYTVTEYPGKPTRPYLYLTPMGAAIFVEAPETEQALARMSVR